MKITAPSGIGEQLRRLAVARVLEGDDPDTVADLLGVSERSIWRWLQRWRMEGEAGLAIHPGRGRPAKLSETQAQRVLDWVEHSALEFGLPTPLCSSKSTGHTWIPSRASLRRDFRA